MLLFSVANWFCISTQSLLPISPNSLFLPMVTSAFTLTQFSLVDWHLIRYNYAAHDLKFRCWSLYALDAILHGAFAYFNCFFLWLLFIIVCLLFLLLLFAMEYRESRRSFPLSKYSERQELDSITLDKLTFLSLLLTKCIKNSSLCESIHFLISRYSIFKWDLLYIHSL